MVREPSPGDPGVMYDQRRPHSRPTRGPTAKPLLRCVHSHAMLLAIAGAGLLLTPLSPGIGWALIVSGLAILAMAAEGGSDRQPTQARAAAEGRASRPRDARAPRRGRADSRRRRIAGTAS